jgi:4-diphosphocytidyl-2-C-methyl-D-erythritol kinase
MKIEVEAHAKINWALWTTCRRPDGYHELDMLMQRLALSDLMTFEDAEDLSLSMDGKPSGDEENLVLRAARALRQATGARRGAQISLVKRIPVRAGLGGGSADCAAALAALNTLWGLNLPDEALKGIGLRLGADVPYCLTGGLCRVRGIGEQVERLPEGPRAFLTLCRLGGGLSTADVFRAWDASPNYPPVDPEGVMEALRAGDFDWLRRTARNALIHPAASLLPEIPEKIERMYALGARFALMSGSGSTVYGVFSTRAEAAEATALLGKNAIVTETLSE